MKHYFARFFLVLASVSLLVSCGDKEQNSESEAAFDYADSLSRFLDRVYYENLERNPDRQANLGIRTNYGNWTDISDAKNREDVALQQKQLAEMKATFPVDKLEGAALLNYRLFETMVNESVEGLEWMLHNYPVNQMFGAHSNIPTFLMNIHKVDSLADAEAYLQRLEGVQPLIDQLIDKLEARKEKGIIPPKYVFPLVLGDCRNIIKGFPFDESKANCNLLDDFTEKLSKIEIDSQVFEDLNDRATELLKDAYLPAYQKLISYLEELEKSADTRDGAWKLPDGDAFYQFALKKMTTTDMTPKEVFDLGEKEVKRIHDEMREIMKKVEFEGDLQAFFEFMRTDRRFYKPNTPEGKQEYLDEATAIIDNMRKELPGLFKTMPKAEMQVKAVEAFRERSAGKAFYNDPAKDGSRPGTYYANLYNMDDMPLYQMEALAYHEGIPGHHMQIAIAMELEGVPEFRKYLGFTAYIEGWALYTEYVPKELGMYSDPYSDFGRLAMELWRACRLVVDAGMHHQKWTREKAIDYLKTNTPNPEGDCIKAIERYIVMPGQATAYKIGMNRILELRQKAKDQMGDAFDIREFHDVVLTNGPVPLSILEMLIDEYIASKTEG